MDPWRVRVEVRFDANHANVFELMLQQGTVVSNSSLRLVTRFPLVR